MLPSLQLPFTMKSRWQNGQDHHLHRISHLQLNINHFYSLPLCKVLAKFLGSKQYWHFFLSNSTLDERSSILIVSHKFAKNSFFSTSTYASKYYWFIPDMVFLKFYQKLIRYLCNTINGLLWDLHKNHHLQTQANPVRIDNLTWNFPNPIASIACCNV